MFDRPSDSADDEITLCRLAIDRGLITRAQASELYRIAESGGPSLLESARRQGLLRELDVQRLRAELQQARAATVGSAMTPMSGSGHGRAAPPPGPGEVLDGYRIQRELGRGAMGVVYAVEKDGARFALKLVLNSPDQEAAERFRREAEGLAAVDDHADIVGIHDIGASPWPYMVLDLIDGRGLDEELGEAGPMALERALPLVARMARALDHIHRAGLVHRDLKPANILIRRGDGSPVLTDFGLARHLHRESLTRTGETVGTPLYMAPEQLRGERARIGPATDIWALGVILVELTTGRSPFLARQLHDVARKILEGETPRPSALDPELPEALDDIAAKALRKAPEDRYSSAAELAADCEALLDAITEGEQDALVLDAAPRRRRLLLGLAGFAALIVLAIPVIGRLRSLEARRRYQARAEALITEVESRQAADPGADTAWLARAMIGARAGLPTPPPDPLAPLADELDALLKAPPGGGSAEDGQALIVAGLGRRWADGAGRLLLGRVLAGGDRPPLLPIARVLPERRIADAARALREHKPEVAREALRRLSLRDGRSATLRRLGLALVALEQGELRDAEARLAELSVGEALAPVVNRLRRRLLIDDLVARLRAPLSERTDLAPRVAAIRALGAGPTPLAELNETLVRLFSPDHDPAQRDALGRALLRAEKLARRIPGFVVESVAAKIREAAAKQALAEDDTLAALYHYLRLEREQPDFTPPKGYRSLDLSGRWTMAAFNRKKGSLERILQPFLAAYRAGVYISIIEDDWLHRLELDGTLRRLAEDCPDDPIVPMLRAVWWPKAGSKREPDKLKALTARRAKWIKETLNHPKLPAPLRFFALQLRAEHRYLEFQSFEPELFGLIYRARYLAQRESLKPGELEALDRRSRPLLEPVRADLKAASELYPATPDRLYLFWSNVEWPVRPRRSAELAALGIEALDQRLRAGELRDFSQGRPRGFPLSPVIQALGSETRSYLMTRQAECELALGNRDKAMTIARASIVVMPRSGSLFLLARIYITLGRLDEAAELLDNNSKESLRSPELIDLRAQIRRLKAAGDGR